MNNNRNNNRRKFIKNSALTLSAFTIVPRHVLGGAGFTAPGSKLNMACIGAGGKGRGDVKGVKPKPILLKNGKEVEYELPKEMIPRSPGHYEEWINECKGSDQRAMSNFDYAGPLNETVLLGNVAFRTGQKINWDAEKMKVTNVREAGKYIEEDYRET